MVLSPDLTINQSYPFSLTGLIPPLIFLSQTLTSLIPSLTISTLIPADLSLLWVLRHCVFSRESGKSNQAFKEEKMWLKFQNEPKWWTDKTCDEMEGWIAEKNESLMK